jgi:hypothetical protein
MSEKREAAILLLSVALGATRAGAQCPGGAWVRLAPMGEPRQETAVAELDGRIYVVGGLAGRANANEIYDVSTDTWGLGANLPVDTDHAWGVSLGGRVYVGGGRTNRVFSYDPATTGWAEVASSTYVHGGTPAAAVIGGGSNPRPGEVTLAHRGVLFLDEFAEFPRYVLEHLRQPLDQPELT